MSASSSVYEEKCLTRAKDLPSVCNETLLSIRELDQATMRICSQIDEYIFSEQDISKQHDKIVSLRLVAEDLAEKKINLAVRNYDLIDHHLKILDDDIALVESVIMKNAPNAKKVDDIIEANEKKRLKDTKKKRKKGADDEPSPTLYEPRYCLCRQVAYGDMIACDNEECTVEWFHYQCVGLTKKPKNNWLCPDCSQVAKRLAL